MRIESKKGWYILRHYYHLQPHRAKLHIKTWSNPDDTLQLSKKHCQKLFKELISHKPLWVVMDIFK